MARLIPLLLVFLAGCAQFQWQKDGATKSDFNRDLYECQTEAARTYPPQVVTEQITSDYTTASTTNCYRIGSAYGNNSTASCITTPGQHVPGVTSTDDVNAKNREKAAKQCMYARDWQRIRVK